VNEEAWQGFEEALRRLSVACERTTESVVLFEVRFEMYAAVDELSGDDLEFENRVADWLSPRWRSTL
jgi:hypothetical protein